MRTTQVLGLSLETRSARRRLIVSVYAILAALLAGGWFLDQLHVTGSCLYCAAFFVGYFILGGTGPAASSGPSPARARAISPCPPAWSSSSLQPPACLSPPILPSTAMTRARASSSFAIAPTIALTRRSFRSSRPSGFCPSGRPVSSQQPCCPISYCFSPLPVSFCRSLCPRPSFSGPSPTSPQTLRMSRSQP